MSDPYDDIPVEVRRANFGWFGAEPWPSGICYDDDGNLLEDMRKPFPVGESCLLCGEEFDEAAGDQGKAIPSDDGICHAHKECLLMNTVGSLAHYEGHWRCRDGDGRMPGMTLRQEALEVWRRMRAGELFGK